MPKADTTIANIPVVACDYPFILAQTEAAIAHKRMLLVSPIASQTIARAALRPQLAAVLARFSFLVPDGFWVMKALEWKYGIRLKGRVYGPELTRQLLALARKKKYRVAFYGTTKDTLARLKANVIQAYPGVRIVMMAPSPFRPLADSEYDALVADINRAKCQLVFIGIGSPLQEEFALRLSTNINPRLHPVSIFTVGAAFDFMARTKTQAPVWMGKWGLEWLYRFINEPGRLWKRYLVYGWIYLYLVAKDILTAKWIRERRVKGKE